MPAAQFNVDEDGSFYVTIADGATVYETYDAAVAEVQDKLDEADDALLNPHHRSLVRAS